MSPPQAHSAASQGAPSDSQCRRGLEPSSLADEEPLLSHGPPCWVRHDLAVGTGPRTCGPSLARRASRMGSEGWSREMFRWFFVGGTIDQRVPRIGGLWVLAGQWAFSGADDGIRTRDPHLGNWVADVSCVSADLSSAPELHVLGALVSSVSADRWSGLDFVGDFVGGPSL
jgi:hypothetical protein